MLIRLGSYSVLCNNVSKCLDGVKVATQIYRPHPPAPTLHSSYPRLLASTSHNPSSTHPLASEPLKVTRIITFLWIALGNFCAYFYSFIKLVMRLCLSWERAADCQLFRIDPLPLAPEIILRFGFFFFSDEQLIIARVSNMASMLITW